MHIAEGETTKVHHRWSSFQTCNMPYGGIHLCSTHQTDSQRCVIGAATSNAHCLEADGRGQGSDQPHQTLPAERMREDVS